MGLHRRSRTQKLGFMAMAMAVVVGGAACPDKPSATGAYSASKDGKTAYFEGEAVATVGEVYQAGGGYVADGQYPWNPQVPIEGVFASSGVGVLEAD